MNILAETLTDALDKMENQTIANILLTLAIIGAFIYVGETDEFGVPINEPTHECRDKEIKAYCYSISSSGITCYTQPDKTGGKQCRGGQWEEFSVIVSGTYSGNREHCNSKGCG